MRAPIKNFSSLLFIGIFIFLFFTSCTKKAHQKKGIELAISQEEKRWMAKFFQDLLLEEGAIFTLWGSKPITRIILYHYTDVEIKKYYD